MRTRRYRIDIDQRHTHTRTHFTNLERLAHIEREIRLRTANFSESPISHNSALLVCSDGISMGLHTAQCSSWPHLKISQRSQKVQSVKPGISQERIEANAAAGRDKFRAQAKLQSNFRMSKKTHHVYSYS